MKIKLFFAAALIATAMSAVAADVPRTGMAVVPVKGSDVFKVIYKAEVAGKVTLNIYNAQSRIILSETFKHVDGFILPVNFRGLQSGVYTIELVDASGSRVEQVTLGAQLEEAGTNDTMAHVSRLTGDRFLLSVVNPTEKITVLIYSNDQTLVYRNTKAVNGDFAQVFKIENATGFTFRIADANGLIKRIQF
jgi:hypothetical protein